MSDAEAGAKTGWLRRRALELYYRLISLSGPPRGIGLGFAIGSVFALSPFFGLHAALTVLFCVALRANIPAGVVASYVLSPVTTPFLYYFEYKLGRWLLGSPPHAVPWKKFQDISFTEVFTSTRALAAVWDLILPFVVGWLPITVPIAVASYFVVVAAVVRYRRRRVPTVEPDE
jgi:uncharacterized protein (DUF2062 family)